MSDAHVHEPYGEGAELLLGPMLRFVSETEATVWVETTGPCEVTVLGTSASTFEVGGHHYALVVVEGLAPDSVTPYEVHLDGRKAWPEPDSRFPPSVVRTLGGMSSGSVWTNDSHSEAKVWNTPTGPSYSASQRLTGTTRQK